MPEGETIISEETTMAEETTGGTVTFTIDVPSRRIEELKQLLEGLEVQFAPENQVIAFNDTLTCHSVAMGYDLPGMVVEMNRYLDEAKLTPQNTRRTTRNGASCAGRRSCSSPSRTSTGTTAR